MPAPYPLNVNGLAYSYRDIKTTGLPGMERLKTHLRAVSWSSMAEADHAHGASQRAYGKVAGPYKPTCEIELAEEGLNILLPLLPPQGYSDFLFTWVLLYAKAQTVPPFKKLKFNNFAILGGSGSWQQGTTPLSRRIPCYVETIQEDIGDGILRCPINLITDSL